MRFIFTLILFFLANTALAQLPVFTPSIAIDDPSPTGGYTSLSLPTDVNLTKIQFSSTDSFVITGPGKLVLSGDIDVSPNNQDMITADIAGDLTKTGDGMLILDSEGKLNSLYIEGGIVNIQSPMSIGALTVGAGAEAVFVDEPKTVFLFMAALLFGSVWLVSMATKNTYSRY